MSFISKVELKSQLQKMGITADENQMKKSDLMSLAITNWTNKDRVFELLNSVADMEEIVKELKFKANQAKRNPDDSAQEMIEAVTANLLRLEKCTEQLKKKLGI